MATKKIKQVVKMLIAAGKATPAPPIGSVLGPLGINLMQFCKEFNDLTSSMSGSIPALITVFDDRTFTFVLKTAPVSELVKQTLKITSGSKDPLRNKVGKLTKDQVRAIAEKKMEDLNCYSIDQAEKMVIGTCKSMGVAIEA
jgi:large subunit ribosomal protein L11